ncbi:MAG: polysaccharide biosynthesis tyrosine autokinase [Xanthobacteraceae bacterium]|nr:polysaccharide biosynthesis tyrosine autokinase [Xanthobacteraceae bacterium]
MMSTEYGTTDEVSQKPSGRAQPDIADLAGIARRGWYYMVAGTFLGLLAALAVLSTMPPVYKASSRIAFERSLARYMQTNKVSNEPIIEDYDTFGQTYVISSEGILLKAIRTLGLASDPDFVGEKDNEGGASSHVRGLLRNTAQALGFSKEPAASPRKDPEKIAFDNVVRDLTVTREDVPSVISIAFSLKDPVKAATIVNAVVDSYMEANLASKVSSTKVAGKVMQERVEELKQQALAAERARDDFRAANKLQGSGIDGLSHGHLAILGTNLTNSRLALAESKNRVERIAKDPDAAAVFTADNELISKQRQELMSLSIRAKDIEKRVGKDHQAAVKIRTRMDEVREAIAEEQKRISGNFTKEYELARDRYDQISTAVSGELSSEGDQGKVLSELRGLEKAADALRAQYDNALRDVSETSRADAQPSIMPDAQVLMRAAPPTQTEASKKRWLILAGGSFLGFLLGGCFLLKKDFPFGVFRTPKQVTDVTGIFCGVLPAVEGAEERAAVQTGEYALSAPYSRFVETLRSVWSLINGAQVKSGAKVVCVMSSLPGEGKTTVATNLAAHFARNSTTRVLLVDADMHHPSLTKRVAPDAKIGLKEALAEPKALSKFVIRKERLNLDVLPCPISQRVRNAAELLGSAEMTQLVDTAREAYDLVIIEVPPISAVVDYKMIARNCDRFVFVVEWGKTSQRMVLECLEDASSFTDRIACIVLNKVDPSSLRSIERYKGERLYDYYSDQK